MIRYTRYRLHTRTLLLVSEYVFETSYCGIHGGPSARPDTKLHVPENISVFSTGEGVIERFS